AVRLARAPLRRDGADIKGGAPQIEGMDVEAKVLGHSRVPRIETLRYKSKKRVRVHRGGRADYTALEILAVGGLTVPTGTEIEKEAKPAKGKGRPKRKAKEETEPVVAATAETETEVAAEVVEEKPKRAPRRPKQDKE